MKERLKKITKGPPNKKYTAVVEDIVTKKTRKISFGASGYQQFRDSTKLRLYSDGDHRDVLRRKKYFSRHSGGRTTKSAALAYEKKKSGGRYTAKILSHSFLW